MSACERADLQIKDEKPKSTAWTGWHSVQHMFQEAAANEEHRCKTAAVDPSAQWLEGAGQADHPAWSSITSKNYKPRKNFGDWMATKVKQSVEKRSK